MTTVRRLLPKFGPVTGAIAGRTAVRKGAKRKLLWVSACVLLAVSILTASPGVIEAKRFVTCNHLIAKYPFGIAKTAKAAKSQTYRPRVSKKIYSINRALDYDRDGVICELEGSLGLPGGNTFPSSQVPAFPVGPVATIAPELPSITSPATAVTPDTSPPVTSEVPPGGDGAGSVPSLPDSSVSLTSSWSSLMQWYRMSGSAEGSSVSLTSSWSSLMQWYRVSGTIGLSSVSLTSSWSSLMQWYRVSGTIGLSSVSLTLAWSGVLQSYSISGFIGSSTVSMTSTWSNLLQSHRIMGSGPPEVALVMASTLNIVE
jgi:hypothetical protein